MQTPVAYEDAVDLLDADHQAVKAMFIEYSALCNDGAPAEARQALAERICGALTVHSQLEEELFYPAVREALGDGALLDRALAEHAGAKDTIERIQGMTPDDAAYDDAVKQLGKMIDQHVLEEREQIFLQARYAALDLRGLVLPMVKRQQQLKNKAAAAAMKEAA
jgi:hemerythrin superfamily protein